MRVFLAIRYLNKPYLEVGFFASNCFFLWYLIREAKFPWPGATGATGSLIPGNDSHARVGERALPAHFLAPEQLERPGRRQ